MATETKIVGFYAENSSKTLCWKCAAKYMEDEDRYDDITDAITQEMVDDWHQEFGDVMEKWSCSDCDSSFLPTLEDENKRVGGIEWETV